MERERIVWIFPLWRPTAWPAPAAPCARPASMWSLGRVSKMPKFCLWAKALEMASQAKGDWRLNDCTLAVTLEPCLMCAGAIWNARVGRVVFGAFDPVRGGFGGAFDLRAVSGVQAVGGVLEEECLALLKKSWNR